jgi:hypothetical protein
MAPRGHGYLLDGGYVSDASLFFCTTMLEPGVNDLSGPAGSWTRTPCALNSMARLRSIGGPSVESWRYGNYSSLWSITYQHLEQTQYAYTDPYSSTWSSFRWFGSYNYRCQPTLCTGEGGYHNTSATDWWYDHFVPYTRPKVMRYRQDLGGAPMFKTDRELAGRCLMTDSWSRCSSDSTGTDLYTDKASISNGAVGHGRGEGYNALYGDGSARWHGDPQRRIRFWPFATSNTYDCNEPLLAGQTRASGAIVTTYWCSGDRYNRTSPSMYNAGYANLAVWHELDKGAGVDVGVAGVKGEM